MQQAQVQAAKPQPLNDTQTTKTRRSVRRVLDRFFTHLVLVVLSLIFGLPFLWLLTTSLKANRQIFVWPPVLLPDPLVWRNYTDTFTFAPLHLYALNSLIIAAAHVFGATVIS